MLLHAVCKYEIRKKQNNFSDPTCPLFPYVYWCVPCIGSQQYVSHVHSTKYIAVTVPDICPPTVPMFNLRTIFSVIPHIPHIP